MNATRRLDALTPVVETYETAGHAARVHKDTDWGGPADWQAQCSCGWAGTVFTEVLYVDGTGTIGTLQDSVADMLTHAGYDSARFDQDTETKVSELLGAVSDTLTQICALRTRAATLRDAHTQQQGRRTDKGATTP